MNAVVQKLPYDKTDPQDIERYAKLLLGRSLRDSLREAPREYKGKGGFGQMVEELYFLYKANSIAGPDFPEAGLELKTSPIKALKRKGFSPKERLTLNVIDYITEHTRTFETSSFWHKNAHLLLLFYLYEEDKLPVDCIFRIVTRWQFPPEDLKIIKDDWEKIVSKIRQGKAHELSGGDTLYLEAAPKGGRGGNPRQQFDSDIPAGQRAFALKQRYLNFIIQPHLADTEAAIKTTSEYKKGQTFEELIIGKFKPFYGKTMDEIFQELDTPITKAKSKAAILSRGILGVKKKKIAEFEKADVEMKTVTLNRSGSPEEDMSFAQIKYKEIIHEKWEESYWENTVTKRFFFVVFQRRKDESAELKKVFFWTMPAKDVKIAKEFWEDTKEKIENDDYKHFIKISDDRICHVRPKGRDSRDLRETPSGRMEKKKSYWLNASYIKNIIEQQ